MEIFRNRSSFLLTQFREFYREVVRLRRSVQYSASSREEAGVALTGAGHSSPGRLALPEPGRTPMVWQPLLSLLERQAVEAGEMGGSFAYEIYREAQYVMCALADEIFLHEEWEGREDWQLLESRLFQSQVAGEEVFNRIDRLLQRNDSFYVDLASVYFQALSIGFQGRYRGEQTNRLAVYRQQLFSMIYRRNPKLFSSGAALFPQASQNVMENIGVRLLPSTLTGLWLVAGVVVIWLLGAWYAWNGATSSISCLMCNLLGRGCVCDVGTAPAARPAGASR
jgi:type VI secretion system protein ImpK